MLCMPKISEKAPLPRFQGFNGKKSTFMIADNNKLVLMSVVQGSGKRVRTDEGLKEKLNNISVIMTVEEAESVAYSLLGAVKETQRERGDKA